MMVAPACAQAQWSLPAAYPAPNFTTENLEAFAKHLAKPTSAQVTINIYPNA